MKSTVETKIIELVKLGHELAKDIDPEVDGYDISACQPESPAGEGWFVGSIHNTEDGAVCIWLRNVEGGAA